MLQYDPEKAIEVLSKADRKLARLIARSQPFGIRPHPLQSPFEALLRAIVYQQLSGKAAATIYGRVQALFPRQRPTPKRLLELHPAALRTAGMSNAKVAAVRDLAEKTLAGTVPSLARLTCMADEEIVERLVQVRGVGVWTVEMLLIFRLGRPDVMPVSDLGVRRGFQRLYGHDELPAPGIIVEHAERWRPYRSVASWYLWRAAEER